MTFFPRSNPTERPEETRPEKEGMNEGQKRDGRSYFAIPYDEIDQNAYEML